MSKKLVVDVGLGALLVGCTGAAGNRTATPAAAAVTTEEQERAPDLLPTPLSDDPLHVTVHALANGMRVYISPDPSKPRIDAHVVVLAGARQEPEDATELAHYLEHMMFKGTDRLGTTDWAAEKPHLDEIERLYGELAQAEDDAEHRRIEAALDRETQAAAQYVAPNEIWALYQALGVENLNARTGHEITMYDAWGLPSERLATWSEIEAERFRAPAFRLLYPELEAVFEERNIHADDPDFRLVTATDRVAWGEHRNASVSTSRAEHLRTPAYGAMLEFFDRWYTPSNLAIVLVGDVTPETALPVLERTLGTFPDRGHPTKTRVPARGSAAGRHEELKGERAALSLVWTTVPVDHADVPALQVLDQLVMSAENGLLVESFYRTNRLEHAWSDLDVRPEGGFWQLHAEVRSGQSHDEVQAALLELVKRLRHGDFDAGTLAAVKLQAEVQRKRTLEDFDGRTDEIVATLRAGQTWREAVAAQQARARVTKEDVVAVADKYLDPRGFGSVAVVEGTPPRDVLEPPKITPLKLDTTAHSPLAAKLLAREYPEVRPEFARRGMHYSIGGMGGVRFVAVDNPRNDLFHATYRFERGSGDDPLLCVALDALSTAGTRERSPDALHEAFARLGARVWTRCNERTAAIHLRGPDENLETITKLVREWMRSSAIESEALTGEVEAMVERRRAAMRDPDTLILALWEQTMRGEESSFLRAAPDTRLRAMTRTEAGARIEGLLALPHQLLYFGPRAPDDARAILTLEGTTTETPDRAPQRLRAPERPIIRIVDAETSKAEVWITWAGGVPMDATTANAYLADEYYGGGMAGLLMQELREARGLVYVVAASTVIEDRAGDDAGLFASLSTGAAKVDEALAATLDLMARPVDEARHASARALMVERMRRHRPEPRPLASAVADWHARGLDHDPAADRWDALTSDATDAASFEAFRAELVAPPPAIVIVGDADAMDLDALRKLGEVRLIERDSLFAYD